MPRTAVILGQTHDGKWELLASPSVPVTEQLKNFRSVLGQKSHERFKLIQYQESDGHVRQLKLRSPDEHAAHEKRRADELAIAKKAGEEALKAKTDAATQAAKARLAEHKQTVSELSKAALANPNRTVRQQEQPRQPSRGRQQQQPQQQQQQQPPKTGQEEPKA